ncbi:glycerol-3-phosphate acyltransferase [Sporosarcina sp. A2]|uniref:glycerol-3-phosphate acyltransferase n=1 Tax=Sporosarcina sp. A2 TaxID=3393449 RepID=UPI003D7A4360
MGNQTGTSIRDEGSGNPGARNVGRVFGKKAFALVLVIDAFKGALAVLVVIWINGSPVIQLLALLAVMLGHCYPFVHRFKGGKGAATFIGGLLAFNPLLIIPIVLCFAVLYLIVKRFTAVSVLATVSIIPCMGWLHNDITVLVAIVIVGLLLWTHRAAFHFTKERNQAI